MVYGAGRTDAGVHALAQVAHVDLAKAWDPFKLRNALNGNMREMPVSVLEAEEVPDDFHARFSATRRYYLYRILNRRGAARTRPRQGVVAARRPRLGCHARGRPAPRRQA